MAPHDEAVSNSQGVTSGYERWVRGDGASLSGFIFPSDTPNGLRQAANVTTCQSRQMGGNETNTWFFIPERSFNVNYSLRNIFIKQRQLMMDLEPVEISLGYTPCPVPLDFTQRAHQDWFRLMSWYLTEELVEMTISPARDKPEELADCLHFMVELCILAGVDCYQVITSREMDPYDPDPELDGPFEVIVKVGMANNLLKAKHWKKEPKPTDLERFRYPLIRALVILLRMFQVQRLNPEVEYMKKHSINEGRIQSGY